MKKKNNNNDLKILNGQGMIVSNDRESTES